MLSHIAMSLSAFFQIPELLQLVAELLPNRDIAQAALASHEFFYYFMPILWESVCGPSRLLSLLEGTKISRKTVLPPLRRYETILLPETIGEQSLRRIRLYGSFVKSVKIFESKDVRYELVNWQQLCAQAIRQTMLPNLLSVTISNDFFTNYQQLPWLTLFSSPSLQVFNVVTPTNGVQLCTSSVALCQSLLGGLTGGGSNIRTLAMFPAECIQKDMEDTSSLGFLSPWEPEGFSSLFRYAKSLTCLSTTKYMLEQHGALELLSSTMLESLKIYQSEGSFGVLPISALRPDAFPALKHLGLFDFTDDRPIRDLYKTLPGLMRRLTSLEVQYHNEWPNECGLSAGALVSLISQNGTNLTSLSLRITTRLNRSSGWLVSNEYLRMLLACPLQHLCIVSASVCDPGLDSVATLFPYLRSLRLPHHHVELSAMRSFVEKMPYLEHIGVGIYIDPIPNDIFSVSWSSSLRVIESDFMDEAAIGDGPNLYDRLTYDSCRKLVHFFHALSPRLQLVSKAYFVEPSRSSQFPYWVPVMTRLVALMNSYLVELSRSSDGVLHWHSEKDSIWFLTDRALYMRVEFCLQATRVHIKCTSLSSQNRPGSDRSFMLQVTCPRPTWENATTILYRLDMCLQRLSDIPELARITLGFMKKKDIAQLIITSRQLFDLGAPILWEMLSGASRLFALIEGVEITKHTAYSPKRIYCTICFPHIVTESALTRLRLYGRFVKSIEAFEDTRIKHQLENWQVLSTRASAQPLLPNLISITLTNDFIMSYPQVPWFTMFLCPSLQELRVVPIHKMPLPGTPLIVCQHLLKALTETCPNMHTLAIFPSDVLVSLDDNHLNSGKMSLSFESINSLRNLETTKLLLSQPGVMGSISCSTQLQKLDIFEGDGSSDIPFITLTSDAFPSLSHLALRGFSEEKTLRNFYEILPATLSGLTSLEVQCCKRLSNDAQTFMHTMIPLICKISPHINNLSLQFTKETPLWEVSVENLQWLCSLPLRRLCLYFAHNDISGFGSLVPAKFPNLESLTLPHFYVGLLELHELAGNLRNLEYLNIGIGLQMVNIPDGMVPVSHRKLRIIESHFRDEAHFVHSGLARINMVTNQECRNLARFFYGLCPKATLMFKPRDELVSQLGETDITPSWATLDTEVVEIINRYMKLTSRGVLRAN